MYLAERFKMQSV